VIAVQELTLRSTQLASSTFDFFSIFFASGLMYLFLTGVLALVQVGLEARFDLDRAARRAAVRWRFWRRAAVALSCRHRWRGVRPGGLGGPGRALEPRTRPRGWTTAPGRPARPGWPMRRWPCGSMA
jgi:polar amino acid transport system permease protein